jgi:hypothetical protein
MLLNFSDTGPLISHMFCTCKHVYSVYQKVYIYKEYHSVCPLPTPLSPASEGLGESQFRRLEKKLSTLPTLWCILYNGWLSACLVSGSTQSRPLRCVPPPQEAEQPVHSVQGVQAGQGAGLHSSSASAGPLQPDTPPARAGSKHSRTWAGVNTTLIKKKI